MFLSYMWNIKESGEQKLIYLFIGLLDMEKKGLYPGGGAGAYVFTLS